MIRLVIVEDELMIRRGIEKHVPWRELEVDEIRTAENAEKAFEVCRSFQPDIILSDICMPGMNGIELCRRFRETLPDSQIVFMSGYVEKEYLMAAIDLGAVSYVEKPISVPALSEAVTKAVEKVKQVRKQSAQAQSGQPLHSLLWSRNAAVRETLRVFLPAEESRILELASAYCIALYKAEKTAAEAESRIEGWEGILRDAVEKGVHLTVEALNETDYILLFSGGDRLEEQLRSFFCVCRDRGKPAAAPLKGHFLGIGSVVRNIEELSLSYQKAEEALKRISYLNWGQYAWYDDPLWEWKDQISQEQQERFLRLLTNRKKREALLFLQETYERLVAQKAELGFYVRNLYFTLDNLISEADAALHFEKKPQRRENVQVLDQALTLCQMHRFVCEHLEKIMTDLDENQKSCYIVKSVMELMHENLACRELSIQYLADSVYLTPTYLSGLFKKKTGVTIGQYLTDIRMKKAQEYLKDPRYKIYQVAELVGYEDANYFAKTFKKKTGVHPSEYREGEVK